MYTVAFSFDEERTYVTQPMNANQTIAFLWDANDQAMIIKDVRELRSRSV